MLGILLSHDSCAKLSKDVALLKLRRLIKTRSLEKGVVISGENEWPRSLSMKGLEERV